MPIPKAHPRMGWFLLPKSGQPYFGVLPDGVEALDGPPAVGGPSMPAASASKAAWVAYAVSLGWSPEDAERKSKKALVAELGEQDVDPGEGGGAVGAEVAGVDLGTDAAQVGDAPSGDTSDDQLDDDLDGHAGDAT